MQKKKSIANILVVVAADTRDVTLNPKNLRSLTILHEPKRMGAAEKKNLPRQHDN